MERQRRTVALAAAWCLVTSVLSTPPALGNEIVRILERGAVAFGSFVLERTPEEAEALGRDPLIDFVFYDMERGEFDAEALATFVGVLQQNDDPPAVLVRIPPLHHDPEAARSRIREVVAAGADGVALPHVQDSEEAGRAISWIEESTDRLWPTHPDGDFLAFLMIEDPGAVAQAVEIVSTRGVSVASPGPGSLRRAYGGDGAAVAAAVETVLEACKERGVPCANIASEEDVVEKVQRGFRLLIAEGRALELGREAAGRSNGR